MTDEPIIKPAFLPKDRDGSIRMIAEVLYGRLEVVRHKRNLSDATNRKDIGDIYQAETKFIENLLNMIECS